MYLLKYTSDKKSNFKRGSLTKDFSSFTPSRCMSEICNGLKDEKEKFGGHLLSEILDFIFEFYFSRHYGSSAQSNSALIFLTAHRKMKGR